MATDHNNLNNSKAEKLLLQIEPLQEEQTQRWGCIKRNAFVIANVVGILIGFVIGLGVKEANPSDGVLLWIGLPGELYMRILKALVMPLIVCCVITGTSNTDASSSGRLSGISVSYILATNIIGTVVGVILSLIFRPELGSNDSSSSDLTTDLKTIDIFADFFRNLFPDNLVGATMEQAQTKYSFQERAVENNQTGIMPNVTMETIEKKSLGVVRGTNILGLIVCCAGLGIAASKVKHKVAPFIEFFTACSTVIFTLFDYIKWTTPVGVASLVARALAGVDDIQTAFHSMGFFILTNILGNLFMQCVVSTAIYFVFTRNNPLTFLLSVSKPWLMGFASTSSAITLPAMMEEVDHRYKVDQRASDSILPICITINRDGSCLFIVSVCLFVAQFSGKELNVEIVLLSAVLTILSSLAIPAVPSSSIVTSFIIMGSLGIHPTNVGLILALEWLLDRVRTTTNIVSHMVCVLVTWRFCKKNFEQSDEDKSSDDAEL